ncbi:hypothetical protein DAPPUDRAFT_311745 [Daphnia pulex]|uniref:Uncharacterized protein n=1 Tax=Daphnia pulex TaxID=6669 RepID=E9FXT0_DAPPU|nr:hypothetical protein DAPPUDRAFT_311745 [Daphnia pulex]|eukprot:EFX88233.1 hypothetical protein DAPPUDRAFT_311745 [Daphnia pulex]
MNSFYSFCAAFFVIGLILVLAIIGWWIFIHTSPFHVTVNKIPGPKFYLPLIGNALDLSGGLDLAFDTYRYTQYVSI